ncbi:AMP-binding protein [Diaphorobacter sp. HDW4B]|uniref:AMP-binding protein n=1 Tax=Diaphorobacter sp. HDW4B TaxID=2714925 RepID=UPI00140B039E|nr:AMP-binding protein [Diaphorobacter sp. HDW4B]QIL69468.1 AMP-binding protein [Diaphorobacter sp. HDW4B]
MRERQIGGFASLPAAVQYAAQFPQQTLNWFDGSGALQQPLSYAHLSERMLAYAAQLARHATTIAPNDGIGPRVGILAATGPEFIAAFCACQYLGWVPCPLPLPSLMQNVDRYARSLANMQHAAGMSLLLGPEAMLKMLQTSSALQMPMQAFETLSNSVSAADVPPFAEPDAESIAYVQFSSGSTSQPKGIAISHCALMHNVDVILRHGMALKSEDRAFSWLPYFHDMGLVGFVLAPLCAQVHVDYLAPSTFARRPHIWPTLMAERGSTIAYAPSFAWQLAARHAASVPTTAQLDAVRIAGVGGDQVIHGALQAFVDAFAKHGFHADAFKPSYGLAEATLAVSMSHTPFAEQNPELVDCGPPLPSWQLTVRDSAGKTLPANIEGEIDITGPSQLSGFFIAGQLHTHAATQPVATGDRGYVDSAGRLFITGRIKDLIIINGRNLWPQDVEAAVSESTQMPREHMLLLQDSRAGRHGALVLLLHEKAVRKQESTSLQEALQRAAAAATSAAGATVHVCMIANGSIAHTSSGKVARAPTRLQFESGQITILASTDSAYPSHIPDTEKP